MWVDDKGVCHTVALADPTWLMSDIFRQSLGRLMARDQDDLDDVLETEETRFFELSSRRRRRRQGRVGVAGRVSKRRR